MGYTLIELMVVMAIMGLITSFIFPHLPADKADAMREEGDRFESLVSYAQTQAILQSQDLGLKIDDAGYSFLEQAADGWLAVDKKPLLAQKLESYLTQAVYIEAEEVVIDPLADVAPSIVFFSSGEMMPFEYKLSLSEQQFVRLKYNLLGDLEKEYVDESQ